MSSGLLPSSLLSTLSNLSHKEQTSLLSHGKYLNLEKYKKGKEFYVAFLGSLSNHKNAQNHNKFINSFEQMNPVHQMLLVSSMKYYQDIKELLLGTENDEEALKHELMDLVSVESVIEELSNISKREDKTSIHDSQTSINPQSSIQSISESEEEEKERFYPNNSYDQDENSKSLIDFLSDGDEELHSFLDSQNNDSANTTHFSESLVKPSSSPVADYDKKVDNSDNQLMPLIKVENASIKDERVSMKSKSSITHLTTNEINKKVSQANEKYSNRTFSMRLNSNHDLNDLDNRHHQLKLKPTTNMSPFKTNSKKKLSDFGSKICDKLIKCLRNFGLLKGKNQKCWHKQTQFPFESLRKEEGRDLNKLLAKSESGQNIQEY